MSEKHTSKYIHQNDAPYDIQSANAVQSFWNGAISHQGIQEYRSKKRPGRPKKPEHERKEQIALCVDADVST